MFQYAAQSRHATGNFRLRYRILLVAVILLAISTAALAVTTVTANRQVTRSREQYAQAMTSNVANALSVANRLDSVAVSNTSSRLGQIRQYVFSMEQINRISVQLFGNGGRYLPDDAFTALYSDLDRYEELLQGGKNSTVEARELMLAHLNSVQGLLTGTIIQ